MTIDPDIQKAAEEAVIAMPEPPFPADVVAIIAHAIQAERDAGKERLREAKNVFQEIAQKWPDSFAARSCRAFLAKEGK